MSSKLHSLIMQSKDVCNGNFWLQHSASFHAYWYNGLCVYLSYIIMYARSLKKSIDLLSLILFCYFILFSTPICIQYFNMYSVLHYVFSTSICIQYFNMDSVLQYGFSTSIWIQYFNMDSVLQHEFSTSTWIQYFNMDSALQYGFSTSIWIQYFNMNSVPSLFAWEPMRRKWKYTFINHNWRF